MIDLIQFPWSPFCIVQRRILEFSGKPFKIVNIPSADRSLVWKMTRQRYYLVPVFRDGKSVVFELGDHSQVLAKYLDAKYQLELFPPRWEGMQEIVWRHIENEIEGPCFKLNDIYYQEFVPPREQLSFLPHKGRKFGHGCIDRWRAGQKELQNELTENRGVFEGMLARRSWLLDERPAFIDFELFGMLESFLFTGKYKLPRNRPHVIRWHRNAGLVKAKDFAR